METKQISKAVIKRLPRYYRYLGELMEDNVERISSNELSKKKSHAGVFRWIFRKWQWNTGCQKKRREGLHEGKYLSRQRKNGEEQGSHWHIIKMTMQRLFSCIWPAVADFGDSAVYIR